MLDKQTEGLLFQVNALCKGGGYQIVEERELLPKASGSKEELDKLLIYLKERKYLDIKYSDDGMYCLCMLPEGRLYFENMVREKYEYDHKMRNISLILALITVFSSIFGAFLGSLLARLI